MEQYYLGFDAGTQSVKTAVYDIDMNLIVQDTNATILNYPHPGWVEMDADQYLHATVTGIRNCVTKMKEKNLDPDNIRSIFGDGIICGIVGVDIMRSGQKRLEILSQTVCFQRCLHVG